MRQKPTAVNGVVIPHDVSFAEIVSKLRTPGPSAWAAIKALGHNPSEEALKTLVDLCDHPDWRYRRSSIAALITHPASSTVERAILQALDDESPYVVRAACDAVGELRLMRAH